MTKASSRVRLPAYFAMLAVILLVFTGCSPDPPDIVEEDVVGFAIAVGDLPSDADLAEGVNQPLRRLVAAYNAAEGAGWHVDTTPSLFVTLDLVDGTRLSLHFSSQFPQGGAVIGTRDAETGEWSSWWEVDAPGLLPAVWELLSDEERALLKLEEQRPWLP